MPHSLGREEFLFSEVGKIYVGSHNLVQGRPWVFGQSRDSVLPAVVHILDTVGKIKPSQRGDPIRVAREVAKIVIIATITFYLNLFTSKIKFTANMSIC